MSGTDIHVGDTVRVKDPEIFLAEFGKKIRDRDAVVQSVFTPMGRFNSEPMVKVEFQKRNGRGKVFTDVMRLSNFVVIKKCGSE